MQLYKKLQSFKTPILQNIQWQHRRSTIFGEHFEMASSQRQLERFIYFKCVHCQAYLKFHCGLGRQIF